MKTCVFWCFYIIRYYYNMTNTLEFPSARHYRKYRRYRKHRANRLNRGHRVYR